MISRNKAVCSFTLMFAMLAIFVYCASAQSVTEAAGAQPKPPAVGIGDKAGDVLKSAAGAMADTGPQGATAPSNPQVQQPPAQITEAPPQMQASAPLRVMVGKSLLITTTDRLRRVSVTDPSVADAIVVTPLQVLVHGRAPGEVSLILWDEQERSRSFDLRVDVDVSALQQEMNRVFPQEQITAEASRNAVVLNGHVATKEDADRAGALAGAFSKSVVNVLTFGPVGAQEVLLEVKIAEVDRTALTQLGINLFSTGATNTIGTVTTQQFGGFGQQIIDTAIPPASQMPAPGSFHVHQQINDVLNLFLFRPDLNLGVVIKALQQKNLLQILAEPNLIAVNGKESSFLAGGEFPYPVVQPGQGFTAVTIQFREFGVRLKFTPLIMPNGNIHLRVAPEVSALDFANALTISGFVVPALSTRKADTELEIQDGQSFVIAGLLDNRLSNIHQKIPGLGDVPILGNFFKSKNNQKSTSELMVLVTAHRIQPSLQPPPLPKYPEKFLPPSSPKSGAETPGGGSK
jgi:pilus assembly protein CpaC